MLNLVQIIFNTVHIDRVANAGDVWGIIFLLFIALISLYYFFQKVPPDVQQPSVSSAPSLSWGDRLRRGMSKSREEVWGKIVGLLSDGSFSSEQLDAVEELLYAADLGPTTVTELMENLEETIKGRELSENELRQHLRRFLHSKMHDIQSQIDQSLYTFNTNSNGVRLKVIMVVGVNGAGKTTTIGKLATKLKLQGANVIVGACDTFRAAAVEQLQVWCDRAQVDLVRSKEGASPSGVAYETLERAVNSEADYCILDTAGRLHNKGSLMLELAKTKDVLKKIVHDAPHEVLLVVDAISGQNALQQAREFDKYLNLTGIIMTKCDGSSKAGSAVAIVRQLNRPIVYIGVGEEIEDLDVFDLEQYLSALM